MFCFQCEQTSKGTACISKGVCGKEESTAQLQDLLVHAAKGIAQFAARAAKLGANTREIDRFLVDALFLTVTNVSFDDEALGRALERAAVLRDGARDLYEAAALKAGLSPEIPNGPARWAPAADLDGLIRQGKLVPILFEKGQADADVSGLQQLLTFGIKGAAAYAEHASILERESDEIYAFFREALAALAEDNLSLDDLLGLCLRCGEINLKVMEILDAAHTGTFGHPVPTPVRVEPLAGKAILVSGHDLKDLEELLVQTQGLGINVYTHGEMLPAHGYPKLKAFPHLAGNYGGAWQDQKVEFAEFPGAILMTTNCIQEPQATYIERIFTAGHVGWPGVRHLTGYDFAPLIQAALAAPGFAEDGPNQTILTGFGRNAVLSVADQVVEAVKQGKIRHFFLVGGCDGAKSGRDYFTEFAQSVPDDCVILTLACGKYRFNKLEFGAIGGIPRLLDIGQCNDAYSAIQIAVALAKAFDCGVNDLPLSMIISWYEQKAVAVLLTLLHLGIRNIRLGPTLPAFITPNVFKVLSDKFNLMPIGQAQGDLKDILEGPECG
jgi:hydroxylamine reductase